jgi:sulfhydrogenase subunit gamma (sulfur reductase)
MQPDLHGENQSERNHFRPEEGLPMSKEKAVIRNSAYEIKPAAIIRKKVLTDREQLFEIRLDNGEYLDHDPGQFVELSLLGVGEAPISVCSSPTQQDSFEICVRKIGKVTSTLHSLAAGDAVGIRGPFGKGFRVSILEGNDLLLIAGGLGIAPLRSLIQYVIDNRRDFGRVSILLGCHTPQDMLFNDEIQSWSERIDVNFQCTVDRADPEWAGSIGVITSLIPGVTVAPMQTFAVAVGPPVMYRHVIKELVGKGIPEQQILLSLERHMKCGLGKCGHCQIHNIYCCQDGPVFRYDQIKHIRGAI